MKRLNLFLAVLGVTTLLGCVNISDFRQPYMQEVFIGSISITPSVRGLSAGGRVTSAITLLGNETGKTVSIFGLPDNKPFDIIPIALDPLRPMNVSGFESEVLDRGTLRFASFSSMSAEAEKLDLEVTGTVMISGPRLSTKRGDPIIIRGRAGAIREHIPAALRSQIVLDDGTSVNEIADDEMVDLYQIKFSVQLTSIF